MLSLLYVGSSALDTDVGGDGPVPVDLPPGLRPPSADQIDVLIAFVAGRMSRWQPEAGGWSAVYSDGQGSCYSRQYDTDVGPLVLDRISHEVLAGVPPPQNVPQGVGVRIVAYRLSKTPDTGRAISTMGWTVGNHAFNNFVWAGSGDPRYDPGITSYPSNDLLLTTYIRPSDSGDPDVVGDAIRTYGMSVVVVQSVPAFRGDYYPDTADVAYFGDGQPATPPAITDLLAVGDAPTLERLPLDQTFILLAVFDSLGQGLRRTEDHIHYDATLSWPVPQFDGYPSGTTTGVDGAVPFPTTYDNTLRSIRFAATETITTGTPPPADGECPPNRAAIAQLGPIRLSTDAPLVVRLDRRGVQAPVVTV